MIVQHQTKIHVVFDSFNLKGHTCVMIGYSCWLLLLQVYFRNSSHSKTTHILCEHVSKIQEHNAMALKSLLFFCSAILNLYLFEV